MGRVGFHFDSWVDVKWVDVKNPWSHVSSGEEISISLFYRDHHLKNDLRRTDIDPLMPHTTHATSGPAVGQAGGQWAELASASAKGLGGGHRYERNPGIATCSKKLLGWRPSLLVAIRLSRSF